MSKIIELNVGGTVYCTTTNTLLLEKNSLFETLISKETQQEEKEEATKVVKDSFNRIFIDRDGTLFSYILDFLRDKLTFVPPEDLNEVNKLRIEAEYYKLENMVKTLENKKISPSTSTSTSAVDLKKPFGSITVSYKGAFQSGREGLGDLKFRKIARILISGRVSLCREVFGETLNESRDPEGTSERYSSRYFLRHTSLEQAFDTLIEAGFELKTACGTSALSFYEKDKLGQDLDENKWLHYNEYVFIRFK